MIRYMLVILCKCTMWRFNKLGRTQPGGVGRKHVKIKRHREVRFKTSGAGELRRARIIGRAQTFIHHQSIRARTLAESGFPASNCCIASKRCASRFVASSTGDAANVTCGTITPPPPSDKLLSSGPQEEEMCTWRVAGAERSPWTRLELQGWTRLDERRLLGRQIDFK